MRYTVFAALVLMLFVPLTVSGNGYGEYPSPLAWSPCDDILLCSLEDHLVMWTPDDDEEILFQGETVSPSFSACGEYAAFVANASIHYFQVDHSISLMELFHAGRANALDFDVGGSSSNPSMCYTRDFLGSLLYATTLRESDVFTLLPERTEMRLSSPVVSPDGKNIACVRFGAAPGWWEELFILGDAAPEGGRARADSSCEGDSQWHESSPSWLSSDSLVFQMGGWGEWDLWVLDIYTGEDSLLIENGRQPSAALDGRLVAFSRRDTFGGAGGTPMWDIPTSVWILDRHTGYLVQASSDGVCAKHPAISTEGEYIAWIEIQGENEVLSVHRLEEFVSLP
ncbi:MAG: hypothetical protein GF388_01700 [Candidatus Aegiribacteria sp.]|nr:hypothetical protein [Candidatus Aegiribacteria sp.]MBD3294088.1 hypothetical protein [Candidatus Fermentibacteria bacterium]